MAYTYKTTIRVLLTLAFTTGLLVPARAQQHRAVFNPGTPALAERKTEYMLTPYKPHGQADGLYLPKFGVKTNLLYLATTSLNAAAEFGLAEKWTLDASAVYNPFRLREGGTNQFWFVQPEARYWFCRRFERHFIGLHALGGQFNIGNVTFLTKTFEQHRYKGWGVGGGISYGYHLPIATRWAMEFTAGVGYVYLEYDRYRCEGCDQLIGRAKRHYFGPTKAGISLVYMLR